MLRPTSESTLRVSRRTLLRSTAALSAAALSSRLLAAEPAAAAASGFTLPALPYAYDALEPSIDAETMKIHHTKHHQAYITNLNKALEGKAEWQGKPLEMLLTSLDKLPEEIRMTVRNNAGGHANHTMFWQIMSAPTSGEPSGKLAEAIKSEFTSLDSFKEKFTKAGMTRFGSGWAWLTLSKGKLTVESTANQDSPISAGGTPILCLDVWEHAYYLKYRNLRADYIAAWWKVVNWEAAGKRYLEATKA